MSGGLKIFYANIEKGLHLSKLTLPKVKELDPDVVAFVEVRGDHVELINNELGMSGKVFVSAKGSKEEYHGIPYNVEFGSAIFIKADLEFVDRGVGIYHSRAEDGQQFVNKDIIPIYREKTNSVDRGVHWAKVKKDGRVYNILLTHFTWSPDASASELQQQDLKKMLHMIDEEKAVAKGFVFMGDLNSPRVVETAESPYSPNAKKPLKGEIWAKLASLYKDNIPEDVSSTIDPIIHRIPELRLCVDFCFTHGDHAVSDVGVKVIEGVSDHKGLFFEVVKT